MTVLDARRLVQFCPRRDLQLGVSIKPTPRVLSAKLLQASLQIDLFCWIGARVLALVACLPQVNLLKTRVRHPYQ